MSLPADDSERVFIDTYARRWPNKPAVIMAASGSVLTYRQLDEKSNQFAQALRRAGLVRGAHVAYMLENSARCFEVIWGSYRAGCYYTPINTRLSAKEVGYIVRDAGVAALVVSASFREVAEELADQLPGVILMLASGGSVTGYSSYEEVVGAESTGPIPDESVGSSMGYSSGTTGHPKGIVRPLPTSPIGAPDPWLTTMASIYGWSVETRYLCPAPLYHGAGLWYTTAMHRLGATVVVMEKFEQERFLATVENYAVDCTQVVPTMFVRMLKLPDEVMARYDLSSLKVVIHAAAPCPIPVKEAMLAWWGPIIYEYYAATEGNGYCWISSDDWLRHKGSVGRAELGTPHIVGDDAEELPPGQAGVIYFESAGVPFCYHNDADKTAESRHPRGWTTVGDIGYLDGEGYLYLTDRKSYMIISGGVNIYPQEAENLLVTHPDVYDVAVIGVPDAEFGEEVKAVVQLAEGVFPLEAVKHALIQFCRDNLAHYKCPKSVDFVQELPRAENGKLYKRLLRDEYWTGRETRII